MKTKISILMFSLLLAVGWTDVAQAQLKADRTMQLQNLTEFPQNGPIQESKVKSGVYQSKMNAATKIVKKDATKKAPKREPNTVTADVTHVYSWYDAITYDWVDANGLPQNSKITEPATTAEQMAYLLGTTYMNPDIPGIQYTEGWETIHPYKNIGYGWDIPNNARWNYNATRTTFGYDDIIITTNSTSGSNVDYARVYSISIVSGNTTISSWSYSANSGTLPSGWSWTNDAWSLSNGYIYTSSNTNGIRISGTLFEGYSNIQITIRAYDYNYYSSGYRQVGVNGDYKNLGSSNSNYSWTLQGNTIKAVTPPYENGYTVFLVKVKDTAPKEPGWVYSWNDLINFFDTHIDEVQLLTDGTRLNEDTDDAGTMFAYSGELNRFYFISKGKMFYLSLDLAPTNSMYEEFSAHQPTEDAEDVTDFYSKLLYGNSYNVIHDCQGVNYLEHYFSMSGKTGTDHRSMTNLIFWIPDNRGVSGTRNYDEEYLPHVGLYTITLEATTVPDPDNEHKYIVTCEWVSSLNSILDFPVDQDYEVWEYVYDENGDPVTKRKVGSTHNTTYLTESVDQWPESYTIIYRVHGWPSAATNSPAQGGNFQAKSNLDPVLIPGYNNFLALGMDHYESDFVIDEEHNYYRNFLTVSNQNPNNALTAKRIEDGEDLFSLYRFDATVENPQYVKAADLLFAKEGNKINYIIDYSNQYYIDDADQSSQSQILTGYKDPNALGCPTYGTIATISESGSGEIPTITRTWDFETDQSSEFTLRDNDGDGYNWYYLNGAETGNSYKTHSGTGLMTSSSWVSSTVGAVTPDNWMISPEVTLGGILKLWACGQDTNDNNEVFGVYVYQGTYSSGTSGFVQIGSDITTTGTMTEYTFDLSAYSGKGRFAIVHHNCTDQFRLNIDDISITNQPDEASTGFELLNDFLDNSTYTQVGQVVFEEPWKSIQVKLQDESAGTSNGYFLIQSDGKLRFIMPAGYNNANLRFVIHNAALSSNYHDGTFTLTSSTGETETITFATTEGDVDRECIFTGISSGDVITITGTHTVGGTLYNYSPDFKYIHVYVEGGNAGISENTALNLAAIKFVDQFKAETREDKHPYRYGYVLKFEPEAGSTLEPQESAKPEVPVQHTGAALAGYYSLSEIDNDTHIGRVVDNQILHDQGITMNVMNSEVNMKLTSNPQVYYYTLDRKPSTEPDANYLEISKLQKREDDTYQEMDNILDDYQGIFQPVTTPRFDNYDVKTGLYNDYMSYVPIAWTHGEQQDNRRIKWNTENRHNSYGAPIWKTGVGDALLYSATAEKQQGWNTTWMDGDTKCRLYMLDGIEAWGYLPSPTVTNTEYEPYMFRIFVESKSGKLRNFTYETVVGEDGKTNKVIAADVTTDDEKKVPKCVWSAYLNPYNDEVLAELNGACDNVFSDGNDGTYDFIRFNKNKVDRTAGYDENGNPLGDWDQQTTNAIFGLVDDIKTIMQNNVEVIDPDDLTIFVRFYYIVKGMSQGWTPWDPTRNAPGLAPAGYGAESPGKAPGQATAVNEIQYLGEIVSQTYYNVQGMVSDKPFDGVNIVVTRFGNGTTSVSKIIK